MKRLTFILACVFVLMCVSSCVTNDSLNQNGSDITEDILLEENTPPPDAAIGSSSADLDDNDQNPNWWASTENNSNDSDSIIVDTISFLFYSVEDLETYIKTGSRDLNDYSKMPSPSLEDMPSNKLISKYLSVTEIFEIDEHLFDTAEVSFEYVSGGKIVYHFFFDEVFIMVEETIARTASEYITLSNSSPVQFYSYQSSSNAKNGYIKRSYNNTDIVYQIKDGYRRTAYIVIDDFLVTIRGTWYSDDSTIAKDYQEFMTSEKTAPIAALFSDEQTIFENTIKSFYEKTGDATLK